MEFVETIKQRVCESNKKVSFSQKSSVGTKFASKNIRFDSLGQSFFVYKDEVIESALFKRVTRDCRGEIIREEAVRRFRKVGSDEWFSVLASIANDIWENDFTEASNEDAIEQGEENLTAVKEGNLRNSMEVRTADSFDIVNPVKEEEKRLAEAKKRNTILILGIASAAIAAYVIYQKNKKK